MISFNIAPFLLNAHSIFSDNPYLVILILYVLYRWHTNKQYTKYIPLTTYCTDSEDFIIFVRKHKKTSILDFKTLRLGKSSTLLNIFTYGSANNTKGNVSRNIELDINEQFWKIVNFK